MARVDLHRLTKRFNNLTAVDDLEISIADGEFLTLLGPSGCGKSTALACIAGLETPTAGTIAFDGADVTERAPAERNIALVFQDYALYPHMSVRDNITFGLRQQRLEEKTIRNQVAAAAEMLDLGGLLERRPSELSGGQRQRVAVGRAVVRNPAVLLMDEPLSNLDAGLRVNTRTEIKRLQREINTTTVFVTHDQEEAMVLSDRIAVIRLGKLQQIGPPMDVYRRPTNIFVAGFIGSPAMNFFPVEISRESDALVCMIGAQRIELPLEWHLADVAGGDGQNAESRPWRKANRSHSRRTARLDVERAGFSRRADRPRDVPRCRHRRPPDQGRHRAGRGAGAGRKCSPRFSVGSHSSFRSRNRPALVVNGRNDADIGHRRTFMKDEVGATQATRLAEMLRDLVDALIPGEGGWPSASIVGVQGILAVRLLEALGEDALTQIDELIGECGGPLSACDALGRAAILSGSKR